MAEFNFSGSIDVTALKDKIAQENAKNAKSKFKNIFWKPTQPETIVRIIPYKHGKTPFNELHFHYDINGETILCPRYTFGKADCPICNYVNKLYSTGQEADRTLAKKFRAKVRYYLPIINKTEIDRGGEPKPYFWGIPPTIYDTLIKYCLEEEDFGDIANPKEGNDIRVLWTEKTEANVFGKTELIMKPKKTPMLKDMDLAMKLYEEVPNIFDLFKELTVPEIQNKLDEYLKKLTTPESDIEKDDTIVESEIGTERKSLKDQVSEMLQDE